MTRKLKINWTELDAAFQTSSWEMHFYLDLETGGVVMVTDEAARYLEEPPDEELPDWMQEMVRVARQSKRGRAPATSGSPRRIPTRTTVI